MNKLSACIWFNNQAEEAAKFYTSVFPDSRVGKVTRYNKAGFEIHGQKEGAVMTAEFFIEDFKFMGINGGPLFHPNPALSFYVCYEDEKVVNRVWEKLSEGGQIMMPLEKYDWSERYGWVSDKYGVSWQISIGKRSDVGNSAVIPSFLFVKEQHGRAEEALNFYMNIFRNTRLDGIMRNPAGGMEKEGTVMHAQCALECQTVMFMDS